MLEVREAVESTYVCVGGGAEKATDLCETLNYGKGEQREVLHLPES